MSSPKESDYRWYACEQEWTHNYTCYEIQEMKNIQVDLILIPIAKHIPKAFDRILLSRRLTPKVNVKGKLDETNTK